MCDRVWARRSGVYGTIFLCPILAILKKYIMKQTEGSRKPDSVSTGICLCGLPEGIRVGLPDPLFDLAPDVGCQADASLHRW